jgi:hypothetical protein
VTINEHAVEFGGKPVVDWEPDTVLADPEGTAYRITLSYEESESGAQWTDKLARFLEDPAAGRITALVVGAWGEVATGDTSARVVEALVAAREQLPRLRALFLGDVISEESEISWIAQSDVSPLFGAYPDLEHFRVRGGNGLSLGTPRHAHLKSLIVESGGLDRGVVQQLSAAQLPELEHLELWLGVDDYGGNTTVADLAPIFSGALFPKLRYLGLRDSEIADAIAAGIAQAPILERIRILDLSMGTLGDEGAAALLASPAVRRLEKLDLHYHFCSGEMMERLQALGIEVDVSDEQDEEDDERYVAVSE